MAPANRSDKARVRRAVIKGLIMEVPLLVAGGFYLAATGTYSDPVNLVILVVVAGVAGMAAAAFAYMKDAPKS